MPRARPFKLVPPRIPEATLYLGDAREMKIVGESLITDPVWPNVNKDLPGMTITQMLKSYAALGGTPQSLVAGMERVQRELADDLRPIEEYMNYERVWYAVICGGEPPPMTLRFKLPDQWRALSA